MSDWSSKLVQRIDQAIAETTKAMAEKTIDQASGRRVIDSLLDARSVAAEATEGEPVGPQ